MLQEERNEPQGGEEEEESGQVSGESGAEGTEESSEEEEDFDKDRALRTIQNQRKSEAEARKELAAVKKQQEKTQKELQKLQKGEQSRVEQLEEQIKELTEERDTLSEQISASQAKVRKANFLEAAGIPNPRVAYGLLASGEAGIEVEWDDQDRPVNIKEIKQKLRKEFPDQFGDGTADGGKRGRESRTFNMNEEIRRQAGLPV